jgi:hypothetical protein
MCWFKSSVPKLRLLEWQNWDRWKNPLYIERYCHKCGEPYDVSKSQPLCGNCDWN